MRLLLWLTLAYAAVLVLTLAVGLTVAWLRLRSIDHGLAAAHAALVRVEVASASLDDEIAPLRDRLLAAIDALQVAGEDLTGAEERIRERVRATAAGGAE